MIGKLFKTEYCVLISIILLLTYFAVIGLVRFITYKISEDNNHTLSKKAYKHLYFIISTYVTMFLTLAIVSIWAGLLASGILSLFFISAVFIQYAFIKKTKDFYRIYEIVKNHECDINDYIEVDNYKGITWLTPAAIMFSMVCVQHTGAVSCLMRLALIISGSFTA